MRAEKIATQSVAPQQPYPAQFGYPQQQYNFGHTPQSNIYRPNLMYQQYAPTMPFYPQQYMYQPQQPQPYVTQQPKQQVVLQQQRQAPQVQQPQGIKEFLPPVNDNELADQPTRWEQEIKIYSYLYRRLSVTIPNLASAKYCNTREVFTEQSSIAVKQYVERAFQKCQSEEERNLMEQYLKNTTAEAKRKNEYHNRDWLKFPLPLLPRENQIRTQSMFQNTLTLKPSTTAALQSLQQSSKFGAPSSAPQAGVAQTSTSMSNLMSLYDMYKQQQVETINLNHMNKNKPIEYSMDFMMLQASKSVPNVNTQFMQQQKKLRKKFDEEDKFVNTNQKIIGTCEDLEKPYFRLTGLPDPNMIRPEHIIKKSLAHILKKWKDAEFDYNYIIEQFRSIRQDLLVQHIQNHFTVQVYEENARICLECGDFPRYESCWTMLCDLYEMISISEGKNVNQIGKKIEFDSYRIVYLTMLNKQDQLVKILHQIEDDNITKFALEVREAYKCGNYVKLFAKYKESPETMGSVINHFLVRIRVKAMRQIVKTFIGNIELQYLSDLLAFQELEHFKQFLSYFEQVRFDETLSFLNIKLSVNAFDKFNFEKMNE